MPLGLDTHIQMMQSSMARLTAYFNTIAYDLTTAGSKANWSDARSYIIGAGTYMGYVKAEFDTTQEKLAQSLAWMFTYIDLYDFGGGPVLMGDIVLAMMQATQDELKMFVGIEDAYHVALWNAPFETEFYADLARKWAVWQ